MELNASVPFEALLIEMAEMHRRKSADYTGDDDSLQNFIDSAYLTNLDPQQSCEVLLGTKAARLRVLTQPGREPKNESVRDTKIDRAVYAVLAVELHDRYAV